MSDLARFAPREAGLGRIEHPETLPDGRGLIVSAEVQEVVAKLRDGDPTQGWEGDPRLALYRGESSDWWEVWRLEHDGVYRLAMRSKPGANLHSLIPWLVAHDTRKNFDAAAEVDTHNAAIYSHRDQVARDKMLEALDRVALGIKKDLGHATDIGPGNWQAGDLSGSEVS